MIVPGTYPAAVTPMTESGEIDLAGLARMLAHFDARGCEGVVLAGTNGEGPSLSAVEKRDLLRAAMPVAGRLRIVLGIATPSLPEAIWLANQAKKIGASAGLVMAPGYFREAGEEGVARWFEALLEATELPLLIYNFPQRTGVTLTETLMARLAAHPRAIGAKDSSGNRENLAAYRRAFPDGRLLFVGDETLLWEALQAGWSGTISGAANSVPEWLGEVVRRFYGDHREAAETHFRHLLPVIEALRKVRQPATHKAILHRQGVLPTPAVRLPLLAPPEEVVRAAIAAVEGFR